jgi:hypothetical protein
MNFSKVRQATTAFSLLGLVGLAVPACGGAVPGDEATGTSSAAVTSIPGCDMTGGVSASSLVSMGYQFVCRYVSGGNSKDITASEASADEAAGLDIVLVWETDGTAGTDSADPMSQGVSDAMGAQSEAASVGAPSTRPIYFAVDFDASSSDDSAVNAYFQGVASVIGLSRTGVYGGYYIVNELFNAGLVEWGWQTYAWSSGQWDSRAQLRQTLNDVDNGQLDDDEGMVADYGQWGPGSPTGGDGGVAPGDGSTPATPCTVTTTGDMGVCLDTSVCASMGGTSTPNYCPGPDNIECCTNLPTPEAGSPEAGSADTGSADSGSADSGSSGGDAGSPPAADSGAVPSDGGGGGADARSGSASSGASSSGAASNPTNPGGGHRSGGCDVSPGDVPSGVPYLFFGLALLARRRARDATETTRSR